MSFMIYQTECQGQEALRNKDPREQTDKKERIVKYVLQLKNTRKLSCFG